MTTSLEIFRLQTLIMYFNWFTTAFIMYGLALSWENLTGGLFLNFLIGTILDFPAKTLAMVLVLKCGRKYPYMISQGITGTVLYLVGLVADAQMWPQVSHPPPT
jgi:OCT family organic cation transporter-like MFS transporter 2